MPASPAASRWAPIPPHASVRGSDRTTGSARSGRVPPGVALGNPGSVEVPGDSRLRGLPAPPRPAPTPVHPTPPGSTLPDPTLRRPCRLQHRVATLGLDFGLGRILGFGQPAGTPAFQVAADHLKDHEP